MTERQLLEVRFLLCIVDTVALAVHHPGDVDVLLLLRDTTLGVAVAGAGAANHHVVDGEVIFLSDVDGVRILEVLMALEFFIPESVEAGEGDSQVCGLQQVLNLLAVRVEARRVELDVGREDPVDDLALGGGSHHGVTLLTHNLTQRLRDS